jgi:ribonuclease HI
MIIKQFPDAAIEKGKMVLDPGQGLVKKKEPEEARNHVLKRWSRPGLGHAKLNTDGAFKPGEGAGIGMVLRDHDGAAIFTACRALEQCNDATEAELIAIEEGLKLALLWSSVRFTAETDCAEAAELIKEGTPNKSIYAFRINSIRELLKERGTRVAQISRDVNQVSHELAKLGRIQHRAELWLRGHPDEVANAMNMDCNPISG